MRILVTGFEPFAGEHINPASEVLKRLPTSINGADISALELPTVFHKSAEILKQYVRQLQPDAIVCVGQAGGRTSISVERIAINVDDARIADNDGNQPIDLPIQTDGDSAYFSTLPIKAIVNALQQAHIPATVSNSAGTYVCNHLMYHALHLAKTKFPLMKAGFIHIPFLPEQVVDKPNTASMSLETVVTALEIIIQTVVAFHSQPDLRLTGGTTH